jgi:dTDP-4-amino-4,6-dideoxygalactose transaminase
VIKVKKKLALLGGEPLFHQKDVPQELFRWPIITNEDEEACLEVIRDNSFSGTNITTEFQNRFAEWQGRKHAVSFTNGTMSLSAAMFGIGLGMGDEIICPTKTYWASVSQAINFGASAVFCNIDENLSMDPDDLVRCIGPRTKAIMVVHYFGYPADMDRIMPIARRHNLKVIEDVSHAQGSLYKGKKAGNFGDVAAMSMMSGKAFAAGEYGILVTDDELIFQRAIAYGHYERNNANFVTDPSLTPYHNIPLGGVKGRANQLCSALALGQLKYYDERIAEVDRAMNYFCDGIEGLNGIHPVRPPIGSGSTMGGWYYPQGKYFPEEAGGLSSGRFAEAIRAEVPGLGSWEGGNFCLHTHQFFKDFDFYNIGKPSRIAFAERDVRLLDEACRPSETKYCITLPSFKKFMPEYIDKYIEAFKTVSENYEQLIGGSEFDGGRWFGSENQ